MIKSPSGRQWLMQWHLYLLPLLLIAPAGALTAASEVYGTIQDRENGQPIVGVAVSIPELRIGTVTDDQGRYRLAVPDGRYRLQIEMLGYQLLTHEIEIASGVELNFKLKPQPLESDEVRVEDELDRETNTTQALTIIDESAMHHARGQTLGETLKEVPGVTVLQTGPSIAKPVIRGLHSERIVIVNAGVPQEGQQWGGEHAPAIDPFAAAEIEVLKGAAGVQYGSSAIGGVIRVKPRPVDAAGAFGGKMNISGFSNNRQGAGSLLLEGRMAFDPRLSWRMQGSLRRAGDAAAPDYLIDNSGFREYNGSAGIGFAAGNHQTQLYVSHFNTELGIFRGAHIGNLTDLLRAIERGRPLRDNPFSYDIDAPKQQVWHTLVSVNSRQGFPAFGSLDIQYGWQQNNRKEFDAHRRFSAEPPETAAFSLELTTHSLDVAFQHRPLGSFFGKIGLNGMRQGNVRLTTGSLIPNFRSYDGGIYALEKWAPGKVTVETGVRFDYRWIRAFVERGGSFTEQINRYQNLSGIFGVIYAFNDYWSISSNLGSGWRAPGVNELYSDGVHHGTAQFETGNPDLTTEKSLNWDLTIRHQSKRSNLQLSVYRNTMSDFIYLFPEAEPKITIRGAFPAFRYHQNDSRIAGFDGFAEFWLNSTFRTGISASLIRGDNLDLNQPLIYMPADRLRLTQHFHLSFLAFLLHDPALEIVTNLVARQKRYPEGVDFADPPAGYVLWDLDFDGGFDIAAHHLRFTLSANNIFDATYRDYLSRFRYFTDDPGRSVILKISLPFGGYQ